MKNKIIQYYVEGADDKKIVDALKTKMGCIMPGKSQVLNVVMEEIKPMHLRTLAPKTTVVLVFDTDAGSVEILQKNIQTLRKCSSVSEIITIPQVSRLESELVRSCDINRIEELLNSKSEKDFKRDVIRVTNLDAKLREHRFDITRFWSATPIEPYHNIPNDAAKVKLKSK